jgi:hypothetical protein
LHPREKEEERKREKVTRKQKTGHSEKIDRPCGLVVRVLGYRSGGPVSIPGTTRK